VVVDTKGKNIVKTVVWLPRLQFACVLVLKGLKNCEQTANITLLGVHKNKKNICVVKRLQAAACKEYYIVLRAWAKNVIKTWCSSCVRRLHYQQHSCYQHTSTHLLYPLMALPVCAARQNANKETLHAGTRDIRRTIQSKSPLQTICKQFMIFISQVTSHKLTLHACRGSPSKTCASARLKGTPHWANLGRVGKGLEYLGMHGRSWKLCKPSQSIAEPTLFVLQRQSNINRTSMWVPRSPFRIALCALSHRWQSGTQNNSAWATAHWNFHEIAWNSMKSSNPVGTKTLMCVY